MTCHELEQFLYPYLDGEFGPDDRLELERHLAECHACARKVHQEGRFREFFRVQAQEGTQQIAPARLRERVRLGLRHEHRRARLAQLGRLAAAAMVVLVAGAAWWWLRPQPRQRFLDDATHWYSKRLPHESQPGTHEQAEAWFGGKLDHRVVVPRFHNATLEGIRLLSVKDRPAAYIGYALAGSSGASGRVGVFVFSDRDGDVGADDHPSLESIRGYRVALWRDGELVYELVSDLEEADILGMLQQLRPSAGARPITLQPARYQQDK